MNTRNKGKESNNEILKNQNNFNSKNKGKNNGDFQLTNFDSIYNFKFLVTCYQANYCYELTRNGSWKKFIPLAFNGTISITS